MVFLAMQYYNPYTNSDFIDFFIVLFQRLLALITGNLSNGELVSDEIQIFVLSGVACSAALLGCFLVLRKMTMLANSLSHTILIGIVLAFILLRRSIVSDGGEYYELDVKSMLLASMVSGLVTTFLTEFITKVMRLHEDASTGLVFTALFALGVVLTTLFTRNSHVSTEIIMGNADGLHFEDIKLVMYVLLANVVLMVLFFKEFKITTFDAGLARSLGISVLFFNYLLMLQASATVVSAFRAVGVLLVLAFIVMPPLIARLFVRRLSYMVIVSMVVGIISAVVGVALSRHLFVVEYLSLSTGGVVVCCMMLFYIFSLIIVFCRGKRVSKNFEVA